MNKNLRAAIAALSLSVAGLAGLAPSAFAQVVKSNGNPMVPGEIVIKVPSGMSESDVRKMVDEAGCEVIRPIVFSPTYWHIGLKTRARKTGTTRAQSDGVPVGSDVTQAIEKLRQTAGVLADPNYLRFYTDARPRTKKSVVTKTVSAPPAKKTRLTEPPSTDIFTPNDALYPNQAWDMTMIRMPEAWYLQGGFAGRTVIAAVMDSGIDPNHPDLAPQILPQSVDISTGTPNPVLKDIVAHGTHVSGTVAALGNNTIGVTGVSGLKNGGFDVKILAIGFANDTGGLSSAGIIAGYNYTLQQKADVINMSFGGQGESDVEHAALTALYNGGVTLVAAAGNSANSVANFPASFPEVISVSSVGPNRTLASYSSFGSNVAIAAPGGDGAEGGPDAVWSTWPTTLGSIDGPTVTNYHSINGTSMAAPHVTGAVAFLIAMGVPRDPATIKNILQTSAQVLPDDTPNFAGGNKYGAGLLDVYSAVLPFADPPFSAQFSVVASSTTATTNATGTTPYVNYAQTYSHTLQPIALNVRGVTKLASPSSVTLEIQTATVPTSVIRTLVGGVDFDIPTLPTGALKGTLLTTQIPRSGTAIDLPVGRYKAVLKVNGVNTGIIFQEVAAYTQPLGRAMFATPFRTNSVDATTPEQTLFGTGASFSLARYIPTDMDYAIFQNTAGGSTSDLARFGARATDGLPLTYLQGNPTVSAAPLGVGYWVNLPNAVTLNPAGGSTTSPVAIRTFAAGSGWNMIGNPFPFPVNWGTVSVLTAGRTYSLLEAVAAGILSPALIGYSQGDYVYSVAPAGQLQAFNGYWVRVYQDCTIVVPPTNASSNSGFVPATNDGDEAPIGRAIASSPGGWKVRLSATVAGDRDGQNYFGQTENAAKYSIAKPPSGAGHAYLRFLKEEKGSSRAAGKTGAYAFDMRATAAGVAKQEWTAAVSSDRPNANVTLTWDGLGTASKRSNFLLTDTATGATVSMRSRSSYTFHAKEAGTTRLLKITMSKAATAGPLAITNLTAVPVGGRGPNSSSMNIQFTTTQDAEVTGTVKTLSGKVVSTLGGATRATATTSTKLHWNGRSVTGASLPAGAYVVEITARSADGQKTTVKQPVLSNR